MPKKLSATAMPTIAIFMWARRCSFTMGASSSVPIKRMPHSGLCAERAAIFAAQSQAPEQAIDAIAVAAHNEEAFLNDPISPCGACRQVMLEMEDRYKQNLRILLYGTAGIYVFKSVKDLMPFAFVDENMRK